MWPRRMFSCFWKINMYYGSDILMQWIFGYAGMWALVFGPVWLWGSVLFVFVPARCIWRTEEQMLFPGPSVCMCACVRLCISGGEGLADYITEHGNFSDLELGRDQERAECNRQRRKWDYSWQVPSDDYSISGRCLFVRKVKCASSAVFTIWGGRFMVVWCIFWRRKWSRWNRKKNQA